MWPLHTGTVEVWNKTDLVPRDELLALMRQSVTDCTRDTPRAIVPVSATEQVGFDRILREVEAVCSNAVGSN
eukprot:COSAG01_NODE_5486_length_4230_cov_2.267974_4_plen_72_part_00